MVPTPDGIRVTPQNAQEVGQRDELKNYTKEELMILAEAKGDSEENKESKETITKSLEFTEDTFRIDSEGWEEVTEESTKRRPTLKKFLDKGIKVKANAIGDVVEYMEDFIKGDLRCNKGEQIFIFDYRSELETKRFFDYISKAKGCSIEEVANRYFLTKEEFEKKMKDKPNNSEEYRNFFNKEVNGHLAGSWHDIRGTARFDDIAEVSSVWLLHGYRAAFNEKRWGWDNNNGGNGLSVRLLKN